MSRPPLAYITPIHAVRTACVCACALFWVVAHAGAQSENGDPKPKAVLDVEVYDFGEVIRAEVVEKTFEVRNEGTAPLEVSDVRISAPGTVREWTRVVPPGSHGEIKIAIDTDFVDGSFEVSAGVYTNDPQRSALKLTLRLYSKPYIFAQPGSIRYVVPRFFEGHGTVEQRLWAEDPTDFEIVRVESPYPFVETSYREVPIDARSPTHDGPQWIVTTRLHPDAPPGPLTGNVRIYVDHEKQRKVSIPLTGFVRPLFAVTPAEADFGDFEMNAAGFLTKLHVKHFGVEELTIEKVESDVDGLEFAIEPIDEGREFSVHILLPSTMAKGSFAGEVIIYTSSENEPKLRVPIRGKVL